MSRRERGAHEEVERHEAGQAMKVTVDLAGPLTMGSVSTALGDFLTAGMTEHSVLSWSRKAKKNGGGWVISAERPDRVENERPPA
jgi:hypothetical protein